MFLRPSPCIERAEISSFVCIGIFLAGVRPVLAGFQFSDHDSIEYSQIKWTPRVELQGDRLGGYLRHGGGAPALQRLGRTGRNPKHDQRSENREVGRQVTRKAPVLAGVAETAASNVESPDFCRNSHEREGKNQHR